MNHPFLDHALKALKSSLWARAAQCAEVVLRDEPAHPFATLLLGVAQHGSRHPAALATLARAVELAPQDAQARYNLAVALADDGQDELAMVEYRACLDCDPSHANALWNYGEMLRLREHFGLALSCFEALHRAEGGWRDRMRHRMAVCCAHLEGRAEEAEAHFLAQLAEDDHSHTRWEYALFLLRQGRDAQAWPHWQMRFNAGEAIRLSRVSAGLAAWDGCFRPGRLVVLGEQGAGDEILFAGWLPDLAQRAAAAGMRVLLLCRPSLERLFRASFPQIEVASSDAAAEILGGPHATDSAWEMPLGDVPVWANRTQAPYLRPDPRDRAFFRGLIGETAICRRRVGLAWRTNPWRATRNRQARDVPGPALAQALRALPDTQFFCLQSVEHRPALADLAELAIVDLSPYLTDFSRTAAAMLELGEVASVCTSTANLAAALGCDLHVLLQHHADWRWRETAPLFPGVRRYRQARPGDWNAPLAELVTNLSQPPSSHSRPIPIPFTQNEIE